MDAAVGFFEVPVLRYVGAKWKLADWVLSFFPVHRTYVEPYAGSAAIFFRKHPSEVEILNDRSRDLVNFFAVLRDRRDELIEKIDLTPYSRAEYESSFEPSSDPLEQARRFYVRCWMAFAANHRKSGWRTQRRPHERGTDVAYEFNRKDGLLLGARRLKQAILENDDALKVIRRYDTPETLFYVDPPYVLSARAERRRYEHEMADDDHRALAMTLHQVRGFVILSGYDSPLYRELYPAWTVVSKSTTTNGNSTAVESLWLSPRVTSMTALPLFAGNGADGI